MRDAPVDRPQTRHTQSQDPLPVPPLADDEHHALAEGHVAQVVASLAVLAVRVAQALPAARLRAARMERWSGAVEESAQPL